MNVFLTGSTGFVGSSLLNRFIDAGSAVVALVRNESIGLPSGVKRVVGDLVSLSVGDCRVAGAPLSDFALSFATTTLKGCDVVVHTAARAHIMRDEVADPLAEYRRVNRDATLALARLAAEAGVKRFVFLSSIKVNGEMTRPGHFFIPEIEQVPADPYGLSKYEAEQGLLKIAQETGMEVVIIRPPLVYGPEVKGNFASMLNWVKKGIPLPLGAVHNLRSLVALDNLVDFIIHCIGHPKAANEIFLISDGEDVSTTALLQKVARAFGNKPRLISVPVCLMTFAAKLIGKGDVANRLFGSLQVDSSKARDLLGWTPVISMDQQLAKMVAVSAKSIVGLKSDLQ
ncbi:MAG: SDR family oxidoreductase [Methyloprofundus sp.]|nr:SDR family oxidoreductase [Methyloprofundus sp.]